MVINNLQGIIIDQMDYKETSKILKLFTRDLGKLSIMAQGAYKKSSRFFSSTNLFSVVEYDLTKGKNFYYLKEGTTIHRNSFLTESMDMVVSANLMAELLNKIIQEGSVEKALYDLSISFLKNLNKERENVLLKLLAYILKFASVLGYQPNFRHCLKCNKTDASQYNYSFMLGGLVCNKCSHKESESTINRNEFILLNHLLYLSLEDISHIRPRNGVNISKLLGISLDYIKYSFDITYLNTEKWLDKMNYI